MKMTIRCICKKCINDFVIKITNNTKSIKCSKCKTLYDMSDISDILNILIKIKRELLEFKKYFCTIYTFSRVEVEQNHKLSILLKYSPTDIFIGNIEDIQTNSDISSVVMPRLDIVAYVFTQKNSNDDFILYSSDINPNLYRFTKNFKIGASFKESIDVPYDKLFSENTEFKDVKLYIFSYLAYLTTIYNGLYTHFSKNNTLVFYPFFLE